MPIRSPARCLNPLSHKEVDDLFVKTTGEKRKRETKHQKQIRLLNEAHEKQLDAYRKAIELAGHAAAVVNENAQISFAKKDAKWDELNIAVDALSKQQRHLCELLRIPLVPRLYSMVPGYMDKITAFIRKRERDSRRKARKGKK